MSRVIQKIGKYVSRKVLSIPLSYEYHVSYGSNPGSPSDNALQKEWKPRVLGVFNMNLNTRTP